MEQFAIDVFVDIMELALPIAIIFAFGDKIVGTFMSVAFGGRYKF